MSNLSQVFCCLSGQSFLLLWGGFTLLPAMSGVPDLQRGGTTQPLAGPQWEEMPVTALRLLCDFFPGLRKSKKVGDKWMWKQKHELVEAIKGCSSAQPLHVWEQLAFRSKSNLALLMPGLRLTKQVGSVWVPKRKHELVETFRAWKPTMSISLRLEKRRQSEHELDGVNCVDRMQRAELFRFARKVFGVPVRQSSAIGQYMVYRSVHDVRRDCKELEALLLAPFSMSENCEPSLVGASACSTLAQNSAR